MTDRIDLSALRTVAESATSGTWEAEDGVFVVADGRSLISRHRDGNGDGFFESAADAEYIAAANPQTVLRLLDALEAVLAERGAGAERFGPDFEAGVLKGLQLARRAITTALGADDE